MTIQTIQFSDCNIQEIVWILVLWILRLTTSSKTLDLLSEPPNSLRNQTNLTKLKTKIFGVHSPSRETLLAKLSSLKLSLSNSNTSSNYPKSQQAPGRKLKIELHCPSVPYFQIYSQPFP
ncbi:hypothetical protein SAY87_001964 [Trapa incisa]|uniref:Uncharacterized protein n=1 Tax=Trapa incisa TaxID=236973 RepID=A0AAN7PYE4_9MYRT|nr:hypothetical protein SAY87_001964 [Trapa incisa]